MLRLEAISMKTGLRLVGALFFLSITSCAGTSAYMKPSLAKATPATPPAERARVRFMRPSGFGFAVNFNILDGERVIGNNVAKSQFDYLAEPGQHLFVATAENKVFLEADLEPGRTYHVITRIYPGVLYARVAFLPVTQGSTLWAEALEHEKTLQRLEPDREALSKLELENKEEIQGVLSRYRTEWNAKSQWPRLKKEDGR